MMKMIQVLESQELLLMMMTVHMIPADLGLLHLDQWCQGRIVCCAESEHGEVT